MTLTRICVFCGSSSGVRPEYRAAARSVGAFLAGQDITVVYGGGRVGLMGEVADATLSAGGKVIGIIPEGLLRWEVAHSGLTELVVVDSMHTRKAMMAERSDAFVALPGGFGTLEELFEVLTWAQLGFHVKPCGILNVAGFFDPLLRLVDHAVSEGFLHPKHRELVIDEVEIGTLIDRLKSFRAGTPEKWLDSAAL